MLIRTHTTKLISGRTTYVVRICGEERPDGTWEGWLEFHSADATKPTLLTEQETSQPNRARLWNIGRTVLSQSTLKARSPERGDDCSSR